jgi:hypothetical protein
LERIKKQKTKNSSHNINENKDLKSETSKSELQGIEEENQSGNKRKRESDVTDLPPPPSAAQVLSRLQKEKAKRLRGSKGPSASPSPGPSSPLPIPTAEVARKFLLTLDPLTESDLIQVVKSKENGITVGDLVKGLLNKGFNIKNNKETIQTMKELIDKCLNQDKATKILSLKEKYK